MDGLVRDRILCADGFGRNEQMGQMQNGHLMCVRVCAIQMQYVRDWLGLYAFFSCICIYSN